MARPLDASRPRALVVSRRGRFWVGEPLFERGEQLNLARGRVQVPPGGVALCRIDRRGAQPIADLGRADRARDVVGALLADRGVRPTFRDRHEQEARTAVANLERDPGARRDLLEEPTFTVDPASAHDFDDAISARREGDAVRIWVHIADVSAHVAPEGGLDREAYERANSTYVPGTVSPMLPELLSSDACSLVPGVPRLAVTAELELSAAGEVRSAAFYRSRIRSDARLDYEELDRIFAGERRAPDQVAGQIEVARAAAAALAARKAGKGLEVSGSEPEFEFDENGDVVGAQALAQTESHRLIEMLMVCCNEQVALLLERKEVPALYRIHEQPDPARVEILVEQLAALGLPTPALPKQLGPSEAGGLATEASVLVAAEAKRRGHGAEAWSSLVLRAMKPARYSESNAGHAGLGSPAYTHFTSPIRRYPDLIAHRALLAAIDGSEAPPDRHSVAAAADHCSVRERDSMKIERSADDVCAGFLLQRELFARGWETCFEGEVSGVINPGAFIRFRGELGDVYEGFFPARRMPGDHYELDPTESMLVGVRTGKRVAIGDPLEVRVESVEAARGRVDLLGAETEPARAPKVAGATRGRRRRTAGGRG